MTIPATPRLLEATIDPLVQNDNEVYLVLAKNDQNKLGSRLVVYVYALNPNQKMGRRGRFVEENSIIRLG